MRDERLEVSVTFDERGYIGSARPTTILLRDVEGTMSPPGT